MKHALFFAVLFVISKASFAQQSDEKEIIEQTCTCIGNAIDTEVDTKYDFEYNFGVCMDSLKAKLKVLDPKYNDINQINSFIHTEIKAGCSRYHEVDSLKRFYSTHVFESIATSGDCEILKQGFFLTYGDKDSAKIEMKGNLQMIHYRDGTYTKSKIVWLSDCSYKVIRKKSTNTDDAKIPKGNEMLVNIIYVKDGVVVYYEIIMNQHAYSGRLIKIEA